MRWQVHSRNATIGGRSRTAVSRVLLALPVFSLLLAAETAFGQASEQANPYRRPTPYQSARARQSASFVADYTGDRGSVVRQAADVENIEGSAPGV
jgi:hypothetical protein